MRRIFLAHAACHITGTDVRSAWLSQTVSAGWQIAFSMSRRQRFGVFDSHQWTLDHYCSIYVFAHLPPLG